MSQAGAALAWQRWLEQRYARKLVEAQVEVLVRHHHEWTYAGSAFQKPAEDYPDAQCDFSGYIEKCATCGELRQIPV